MSISSKLWLFVAAAAIAMSSLMAFTLNETHKRLMQDKKEQLHVTSDIIVNEVKGYINLVKDGKLSENEAKQQALNWLKTVRYENNNYFWITDKYPKMIMHPIKPSLDGTDLSKTKDKVGNKLFVEMVSAVNSNRELGYVEYYWTRPGQDVPVPKLSVVREIPAWGWVIGTGIYIDDIDEAFQETLRNDLIITFISLLILFLIAFFIIRQVTTSINNIVQGVRSVEESMEFKNRLPVLNNELGRVSDSFNSLLGNISNSIEEANQVVQGISRADFSKRIKGDYKGDLKALKQGVNGSAENIDFMMRELEKVMNGLDSGDLQMKMDARVPKAFRDKIEGALESVNEIVDNVNHVMRLVSQGDFKNQINVEAYGSFDVLKTNVNSALN